MKNPSCSDFENAASDFRHDVAASLRHREILARENREREEIRSRFHDWALVRAAASAVRAADLSQLERRLTDFASRFEGAGGCLHWAPSPEDAREALREIAREAGVRSCVAGLSSTLTEVGADEALRGAGVAVRHTQFGDLVNGLSGGLPSHFLHPAMHLSREEIGEVLHSKMGAPTTSSPEEQVEIVRKSLRSDFLQADMGLTGAAFLLADEGKVVLLENEGNLRLIAACPRVLVVVAGIDKVTGGLHDLSLLLQVIGASSGGRPMPAGVTVVGPGARPSGESSVKMHLILVDNARSRLLADPAAGEILRCVKCGACADVCPVFLLSGGRSYRSPLPGPLGAVLGRHLMPGGGSGHLAMATSLCGACGEVCPVGIDMHRALVAQRRELPRGALNWRLGVVLRLHFRMMSSPSRYRSGSRWVRLLFVFSDLARKTPFNPLSDWTRHRVLPVPPKKTFRSWWKSSGGERASIERKAS